MTLAATFLGGAKSRLLPPSIPLGFFASAAVFHVLLWVALFFGAGQATNFAGGLGPVLSAAHILTLGVLTTTAIGASVQLLPVATRHALAAVWPIKLVFWLTVPGIAALLVGMYWAMIALLIPAAMMTSLGLLLYAGLLADNLRRAGSMAVVAAYGWAALGALVLLIVLGLALSLNYRTGFFSNHAGIALAHMILGGFGFMGLLALGFSYVLVPMFALSSAPARNISAIGFVLAFLGVGLGTFGALIASPFALAAAGLSGLGAAGIHLWQMHCALKAGMRKRLGLSFVLVRCAWVALPVTLLVGLASLAGLAGKNGPTLFGFLLLWGWLLTFLLGILQRILPFLASMHVTKSGRGPPPLMSELAAAAPLKLHALCHGLALILAAIAIIFDTIWLIQLASAVGFIGAVSFALFTFDITRRVFLVQRS
jgi:hypothetical protein